jgi:UPF0042 nucleotide-binding protein
VKQRLPPITILTGKAGAGKRTAMDAFEDAGYYCVDNMPIALLPAFLESTLDGVHAAAGLVFGMDLRDSRFVSRHESVLTALKKSGYQFRIVFLDADDKTLLRRYSQTRRAHPLSVELDLREAMATEANLLAPLRRKADRLVDTSELTVHDLKTVVRKIAQSGTRKVPMRVQIISFGFRFGLPMHADLVMDVRFLKNPYFIHELRPLSGESEKIRSFVLNNDQTCLFLRHYFEMMDALIPQYENEGKAYLTIAIGCTGGRHRSVVIATALREHITASGRKADLSHRDIDKTIAP